MSFSLTHHSIQYVLLKSVTSTDNTNLHTPQVSENNLMHITPAKFLQYSQINPYNYYEHYTLVKYLRSVQTSYCILSISGILEFHKSKTWGIPGYPHNPQWTILAECRFNFVFRCTASQITNIHFARQIPLTITRHPDTSL